MCLLTQKLDGFDFLKMFVRLMRRTIVMWQFIYDETKLLLDLKLLQMNADPKSMVSKFNKVNKYSMCCTIIAYMECVGPSVEHIVYQLTYTSWIPKKRLTKRNFKGNF